MNKLLEAAEYFKKAAELQEKDCPINALSTFQEALHCNLLQRNIVTNMRHRVGLHVYILIHRRLSKCL